MQRVALAENFNHFQLFNESPSFVERESPFCFSLSLSFRIFRGLKFPSSPSSRPFAYLAGSLSPPMRLCASAVQL